VSCKKNIKNIPTTDTGRKLWDKHSHTPVENKEKDEFVKCVILCIFYSPPIQSFKPLISCRLGIIAAKKASKKQVCLIFLPLG
jgi:hypothetical protein